MLITAYALAAASLTAQPDLTWLSGDWIDCSGDTIVEERWLGPAGGVMIGANLTRGKGSASFEFFRIARSKAGNWAYFAQPGGRPPVEFTLTETNGTRAVFQNLRHDFPQRVIYWRDGENLAARVEGRLNGKLEAAQWRFAPKRADSCKE